MNELIFSFRGNNVRMVEKEGEVLFLAKDVCEALGIKNHREAVSNLEENERVSVKIDTPGGKQIMTSINEYGLYQLIMNSRKPEAKEFKRWVTHEVLPSIRKHGAYMTTETAERILEDPDSMIKLLEALKEEREKLVEYKKEVQPKVLFSDAVNNAENTITVAELSKIITQNGYAIGQNKMYEWLRNNGYLVKANGQNWNTPKQRFVESGLFVINESVTLKGTKSVVTTTTRVTGKGQQYFVNKFLGGLFVE